MPRTNVAQFSIEYLQILDEQGNVDDALDPKLSSADLVALYEWMTRAREADQRMLKLQRQGRMGTFPLCTGQEAMACGATFALREDDWFVGSYRELGGRMMRGEPLLNWYKYWNGYEEGNVMPEGDATLARTLPVAAVVGAHTLHAVGLGYACKYRGEDSAVLTFFGDGASSEGDVLEAMNFAGVWKAPVVFVCNNNQWAISLPREAQTASQTIAQKAVAFGFPGVQVDGNDVLAVYRATREALDRARRGEGPTLIECLTYRLMMHTTADDPKRYQPAEEVEAAWKRDPIPRLRTFLRRRDLWNDDKEAELQGRIKAEIGAVIDTIEGGDLEVKIDAPFDHVYGTPHPSIEAQRRAFLERYAKENG